MKGYDFKCDECGQHIDFEFRVVGDKTGDATIEIEIFGYVLCTECWEKKHPRPEAESDMDDDEDEEDGDGSDNENTGGMGI